jgi:hypothetical protein
MASRVFVSFDSEDIRSFHLMKAWKENENIDFDFINMQLETSINSQNEAYIKGILRKKITNSGTFIQLIGQNTKSKHKYVRWEAEVAIEKNCKLIGVNLNGKRSMDDYLTPPIFKNKGAIFVSYSPKIIKFTLDNFSKNENENWYYEEHIYKNLGL